MLKSLDGLSFERREVLSARLLEDIPDQEQRDRLESFFKYDLERERTAIQARDNALARDFRERAATENLSPAQAMEALRQTEGLSDTARASLEAELLGGRIEPRRPTPESTAALDSLRLAVDNGEIRRAEQVELMAADHGLTDEQTKIALKYLEESGNTAPGRLTAARLDRVLQSLTGGQGLADMPGFHDELLRTLIVEPGKPLTEKALREAVSDLLENSPEGRWSREARGGEGGLDGAPDNGLTPISDTSPTDEDLLLADAGRGGIRSDAGNGLGGTGKTGDEPLLTAENSKNAASAAEPTA